MFDRFVFTERHWRIEGVTDRTRFFSVIPKYLPENCILHFEGHRRIPALSEFLADYPVVVPPRKTFGRRPRLDHYVIASQGLFEELVRLSHWKDKASLFDSLNCYHQGKMLFYFHDAFTGGELLLHRSIRRTTVRSLCRDLSPSFAFSPPTV